MRTAPAATRAAQTSPECQARPEKAVHKTGFGVHEHEVCQAQATALPRVKEQGGEQAQVQPRPA